MFGSGVGVRARRSLVCEEEPLRRLEVEVDEDGGGDMRPCLEAREGAIRFWAGSSLKRLYRLWLGVSE